MKVLVVYRGNLPSYGKEWRGKSIVGLLWEILTKLKKEISFEIICFGYPGQPVKEEIKGMRIRRVVDKKNIFGEFRTGFIISFLSMKILLQRKVDIFHIIGEPMWHAGGIFLAKILKIPVLLTFLDPWYPLSKYEFSLKKHSLKQKIFYFFEVEFLAKYLEKIYSLLSDKITVVSKYIKEHLGKRGINKNKIEIIPNGVNIHLFNPEKFPHRFNYTIGYLGSLYSIRGIFKILEAFEIVKKQIPQAKLLYIGDGRDRKKLEKEIERKNLSDSVDITGRIPYPEVPQYLSKIDIGFIGWDNIEVMQGSSPLKLFEYLAMEKAVVGGTGGQIEEVLNKGYGIHLEKLTPEKIAESIINLFKNPEKIKKMGELGRKYVLKNHSWDIISERYYKIYKELLK